ncbi:MAG: hypothetical protein GX800_13200 [Clostridiaceae bacterium]|nr:hypothetical protein [Clostridiaceae bacterium]
MATVSIDTTKTTGKVKPMHAVNNGPVYKFAADQRITNIDAYREAGIPYARNHDASFYSTYGGEHIVDINFIFTDFSADPYDPASYDFVMTDEYIRVTEFAGTKTFYRLGSKIEHWIKKYNTLPPADFQKWAVICEHIIKHYNYGWADGFHYGLEYWEIWNEADLDSDDSPNKRTWGGTKKQYFELYDITANHLKKCFPELKIGGPALAYNFEWAEDFLSQLNAPLDFFSWHIYVKDPKLVEQRIRFVRELLDKHGYTETESILNEWNYVRGWEGDDWIYSRKTEKNYKGAAFIAGVMCIGQNNPLDMLMYYDARPCGMNGMFNTDLVCDLLKGYYPFLMFNSLYKLDKSALVETDDNNIFACAAVSDDKKEMAAMVVYYDDNDDATAKEVKLSGLSTDGTTELFILDKDRSMEKLESYTIDSENNLCFKMPLCSVCLIKQSK